MVRDWEEVAGLPAWKRQTATPGEKGPLSVPGSSSLTVPFSIRLIRPDVSDRVAHSNVVQVCQYMTNLE